jgi:hypothetical protein
MKGDVCYKLLIINNKLEYDRLDPNVPNVGVSGSSPLGFTTITNFL